MEINIKWNMCIVCLAESDSSKNSMKSIYEKDLESIELIHKIMCCGGIDINEDENLPHNICIRCVGDLEVAYKFRARCRKANTYFKSMLEKAKTACGILESQKTKLGEYERALEESIGDITKPSNEDTKVSEEFFHIDYLDDGSLDNLEQELCNDYIANESYHEFKTEPSDEDDLGKISDSSDSVYEIPIQNEKVVAQNLAEQEDLLVSDAIKPVKYKRKKISKESRPFICEVCGNNYSKRTQLTTHRKTHLMEKPYECEICQKKFSMSCNLIAHIRIHTGEKPYICRFCERKFTNRSTHLKHERVHTNERPFECQECGKSFSYSTSLKAHLKIHTGEKAYRCDLCMKMFALPHQLKAHLKTITHRDIVTRGTVLARAKNDEC